MAHHARPLFARNGVRGSLDLWGSIVGCRYGSGNGLFGAPLQSRKNRANKSSSPGGATPCSGVVATSTRLIVSPEGAKPPACGTPPLGALATCATCPSPMREPALLPAELRAVLHTIADVCHASGGQPSTPALECSQTCAYLEGGPSKRCHTSCRPSGGCATCAHVRSTLCYPFATFACCRCTCATSASACRTLATPVPQPPAPHILVQPLSTKGNPFKCAILPIATND